jgi:hypothetical protein
MSFVEGTEKAEGTGEDHHGDTKAAEDHGENQNNRRKGE